MQYDDEFELHFVSCQAFGCFWRTAGQTLDLARERWNTRQQPAQDVVEALAEKIVRGLYGEQTSYPVVPSRERAKENIIAALSDQPVNELREALEKMAGNPDEFGEVASDFAQATLSKGDAG
ncbi:hypothetical protein ACRAQ6_14125 [Erythrobacter sp. HA6-11]